MSFPYKLFNVDNNVYVFCVDDLEIFRVSEPKEIDTVLKEIEVRKKINSPVQQRVKDRFSYSKIIDTIGIDLANGCTLACTYCYISASGKPARRLSKEKFLEILTFLKTVKGEQVDFFFTGAGEPTLNFNLLKEIPSLCKENGFNKCTFDLTTNGTILTEEMIDFFKANEFILYVSLDGNEKINDTSRIYPNGKGAFEDVFLNIKRLKENDIDFSCKAVVRPDSKDLAKTFHFFEENKIHFKFYISTSSFDNQFSPGIECFKNFESQLDAVICSYKKIIEDGHKIYADKILGDLMSIHYGVVKKNGCGASKNGFFIDIDGNIFPCSYHSSSKELAVGDIYTGIDYDKIVEKEFYAKPVDSYPACSDCWMKYLCSGSCFAVKWLENKNTNEPSSYLCKFNDVYWSAILKLYTQVYHIIAGGNNVNFISPVS